MGKMKMNKINCSCCRRMIYNTAPKAPPTPAAAEAAQAAVVDSLEWLRDAARARSKANMF
jgi:hypothetical protein